MRLVKTISILALLLLPCLVQALDTTTRTVGPIHTWTAADLGTFDPGWVHVKFVEGSRIHLEQGVFVSEGTVDIDPLNTILGDSAGARRSFTGDKAYFAELKAVGQSRSGRVGPDLSLWFDIRVPGGAEQLAAVINRLNQLDVVEIAHPSPVVEPAALKADPLQRVLTEGERAVPPTPDFTAQQNYLGAPPVGLNAAAVWAFPGGRGADVKFIDVELGWVHDHEDFTAANQFYQGGAPMDPFYFDHGTAVLGEVIGADNGYGVTGFASDATWGMVAVTAGEWPEVSHYFQEAVDNLAAGDVWLIELQMYPPGRDATPMEWLQMNYDVIWTSSWSREVVCIEAAANGGQNLDDPTWGGVFDRNVRDSGAIMVAAGTPYGLVAESWSNYGSRADVHAWGSLIVTTGYGDLYTEGSLQTEYTSGFGGTSGASPMVTGSALCLQGFSKVWQGSPMTPVALRALLSSTGTPHQDPSREIGPRPDLEAAVNHLLGGATAPDGATPVVASLQQNHPNPFNPSTEITFVLTRASEVELSVFDTGGRRVTTLISGGEYGAGRHICSWSGRDDNGVAQPSGVYLYQLRSGDRRVSRRMTLLK